MEKNIKLGHQSPSGYVMNRFNRIEIPHNNYKKKYMYNESYNFVYNSYDEKMKLYMGLPCYYTDKRYYDEFTSEKLKFNRRGFYQSLKSLIRFTNQVRNIPIGTIVEYQQDFCYKGTKIKTHYNYKIKKELLFETNYKIDLDEYFNNFTDCDKSKNLVELLRKNGFIVSVFHNENANQTVEYYMGQHAIGYGHGITFGFASNGNKLFGYSDTVYSISFDKFNEFDKWSKCNKISQLNDNHSILNFLLSVSSKY